MSNDDKIAAIAQALGLLPKQDTTKDVKITRDPAIKMIQIPEGMSYAKAREWLTKKEEEENTKVAINEIVHAFPLDGAYAFMRALQEVYGWTELLPTPGTFFSPEQPPQYITIDRSVDEKVQIMWGRVAVPAIAGYFETGFWVDEGRVVFKIGGETKKKHVPEIKKLGDLTRRFAKEESIYKGKAVRVTFPDITKDKSFHPLQHAPHFIDTRHIKEADLIFPDTVAGLVETTLFTPIRATDWCRMSRIPLKRGILLEGPFGTGKTLTANVTAMLAERHGWTFVYVENVKQLHEAMLFAKQYQPAVIFAEDVDRADDKGEDDYGERSELMNRILNTLDGVEMKGTEIMVVVTTNYPEHINRAMLRPGRLDAVIPVRAPDAEACVKLVRLFARSLLAPGEDLSKVGEKLSGNIPAVVREVVERSKLAAIARVSKTHDGEADLRVLQITARDLEVAADGMNEHLKLLQEPVEDTRSDVEKAASIIADAFVPTLPLPNPRVQHALTDPESV